MSSSLNNGNNQDQNQNNGSAVYTRFSSSSTMDLVALGEQGRGEGSGVARKTTPTVSIHIDNRSGRRGQIGSGARFSMILAFFGGIWRGTVQFRIPFFVLIVVLCALLPFVLVSIIRTGTYQNQDQNHARNLVQFSASGLEELAFEASKTVQAFAEKQTKEIEEMQVGLSHLMQFTELLDECLMMVEMFNNSIRSSASTNGNNGVEDDTATTTSTSTLNLIQKRKPDDEAEKRQMQITAFCGKLFDWLRANPWHSVDVLKSRRAEFQRYAEQALKHYHKF